METIDQPFSLVDPRTSVSTKFICHLPRPFSTRRMTGVQDQLRPDMDQQSNTEVFEAGNSQSESTSTSNSNDLEACKVEDRRITELNGETGYFIKKGTQFVPVTNFSVTCTGYVTENSECGSSEGFLFHVLRKTTLVNGDEEIQQGQR